MGKAAHTKGAVPPAARLSADKSRCHFQDQTLPQARDGGAGGLQRPPARGEAVLSQSEE